MTVEVCLVSLVLSSMNVKILNVLAFLISIFLAVEIRLFFFFFELFCEFFFSSFSFPEVFLIFGFCSESFWVFYFILFYFF